LNVNGKKSQSISASAHRIQYKKRSENMPEDNLREILELGFRNVGSFSFKEQELQFSLTANRDSTGSYAFVVGQKVMYIGVTKNTLYARMNGYKNPGPSQETNKRIKPKIVQADEVQIYFLSEENVGKFKTTIQRDDIKKEIPTDLSMFERFLISLFKPSWNLG
jgi:hypothetical protein